MPESIKRLIALPAYTTEDSPDRQLPLWSSRLAVPEIGDAWNLTVLGLGVCRVAGYVIRAGHLGIVMLPGAPLTDWQPPEWWLQGCDIPAYKKPLLVFGRYGLTMRLGAVPTYSGSKAWH